MTEEIWDVPVSLRKEEGEEAACTATNEAGEANTNNEKDPDNMQRLASAKNVRKTFPFGGEGNPGSVRNPLSFTQAFNGKTLKQKL